MARVTRAAAWGTKHTAPTVPAVLHTGIGFAQENGDIVATLTASAAMVHLFAILILVSQGTVRVHPPLRLSRYHGRLGLHRMVAVEAQTNTLATWFMGAAATRMVNVGYFRLTAVPAGESPFRTP